MKVGQLAIFNLSSAAENPYGSGDLKSKYQGQRGPTASKAYLNFR
jgi:dCTP deaminase